MVRVVRTFAVSILRGCVPYVRSICCVEKVCMVGREYYLWKLSFSVNHFFLVHTFQPSCLLLQHQDSWVQLSCFKMKDNQFLSSIFSLSQTKAHYFKSLKPKTVLLTIITIMCKISYPSMWFWVAR